MGKFIIAVDDFFKNIIEDDGGRFFCLHLPFWGIGIVLTWHLIEYIGPFLLFGAVIFWLTPMFLAQMGRTIYAQDELQNYTQSKWGVFRFSLGLYVVSIFTLIGIPWWYLGYLMDAISTKTFGQCYWKVLVYWYEFFNFYHKFSQKDLAQFVTPFAFEYRSLQIALFVSATVITPILFYYYYQKAKSQVEIEEREQRQFEFKAREKEREEEIQIKKLQEANRLWEEQRRKEQEAKKEEERKLQVKLNEVKGKDPWESGFL